MRGTRRIGGVTWLLATTALAPAAQPPPSPAPDIDTWMRHLEVLGDDALAGRAPGTPGGRRAAEYLAQELSALGLEAPPGAPGHLQPVPLHAAVPLAGCRLVLTGPDSSATLALWDDYVLFATGAETEVVPARPIVFAGYGIVAPEWDYDDYHAVEVTDAIVVFLAGEPPSSDPWFFDGDRDTHHADVGVKRGLALAKGAAGSILVVPPEAATGEAWARRVREFRFTHITLGYGPPEHLSLVVSHAAAARLFAGSGRTIDDVWAMHYAGTIESFPLGATLAFQGAFDVRDFRAPNVAGVLRGADPLLADRYVLVSAHYDHLGVGAPVRGDSIYNGVVDNASGVAASLEIARALRDRVPRPRRSLLFLFVTAEEEGLLGSRYYTDHPLVPLHRTVANVNVDGIAFLDTFDDVVALGSTYSTLSAFVEASAAAHGLRVSPPPIGIVTREAFGQSDQLAFAEAGIPSVLVQEGLAYRHIGPLTARARLQAWGLNVYHTPFDDLAQPIDTAAARQHMALLVDLVGRLSDDDAEPVWFGDAPYALARLHSLAEER